MLFQQTQVPFLYTNTGGLTPSVNTVPGESDALFWPLKVLHTHGAQAFSQAKLPNT